MGLQDAVEAIPRKTMVLFFLIDTSGSMAGSKIGAVNAAIEEVIPELRDISQANADALVKVAALEFSSGVKWITSEPLDVDQFHWNNIDAAGMTDLGAACAELSEKLSTKAFMREATGSFAPALFLLSDGAPTDDFDAGLLELQKNNWYKQAIKVAIAIGDDAQKDTLARFTGGMESVLEVHNAAALKKLIKFVSVRASKIASQSALAKAAGGGSGGLRAIQPSNPATAGAAPSAAPMTGDSPAEEYPSAAPPPPAVTTEKQKELNRQLAEVKPDITEEEEW
jgi:uncharacterized protein YegL